MQLHFLNLLLNLNQKLSWIFDWAVKWGQNDSRLHLVEGYFSLDFVMAHR